MYSISVLSFCMASILAIVSTSPLARQSFTSAPLQPRYPLTDAVFSSAAEWATNVVFTAGSQTCGFWVPEDGIWHDLGDIECLCIPANAIGDCNDITVDQIGVVAGDGPCSFTGIAGYGITMAGNAGDGYQTVGPPQNIMQAKCGPI